MSQPALSRAIGRLEAELGVPLFDRVGRTVRLNRYGEIFHGRVEEAFKALDTGWSEITDAVDPNRGIVTLAFMPTIGPTLVPRLFRDFRRTHANVRFQLSQGGAGFIVAMLLDGSVDLCLTAPDPKLPTVNWVPLWSEPLVLAVPEDHPLAGKKEIDLADLAGVPVVTLQRGFGLRQITEGLFDEVGVAPSIVFEAADVPTVRGLVATGLGVSILPPAPEKRHVGMPIELPIRDVDASRVVGVARVTDRYMPAVARAFFDHVVSMAEASQT